MGYFRHKLDRARSRGAVNHTLRRQAQALTATPLFVRTSPSENLPIARYRRFAVRGIHQDSQHHRGLFCAAGELQSSNTLWREDAERLGRALHWFNTNLVVPKNIPSRAIFWFKRDADQCHRRTYEIVRLLRGNGYTVWTFEAVRTGRVVYEDDLQVAAVPFAPKAWTRAEPGWEWETATARDVPGRPRS
jgi:hypothetical protein